MKIGIITRWCSFNYGSNLQLFALSQFLKDAGHSPFLIRYYRGDFIHSLVPNQVYGNDTVPFMQYLGTLFCLPMEFYIRQIGNFTDQYFDVSPRIYQSGTELCDAPPDADAYITGSDQVWNFWSQPVESVKNGDAQAMFLLFGKPDVKRLSFAASFGNQTLDNGYKELFTDALSRLDYVSLREKAACELVKQCGVENPDWVPDPTLLLPAKTYRRLLPDDKKEERPDKPYILLYLLNQNPAAIERIQKIAEQRNTALKIVGANLAYSLSIPGITVSATVPQFVHLIANADYVFTDSFHGTAFSLIFNRQFANLPSPRRSKSDTRFQSIFERLGVETRTLDDTFVLPPELDYVPINKNFDNVYAQYSPQWFNEKLR
ncbi:MAG: polysaccharide pyruvyl transferase family protein [Planctomycetaceae bacterium]|jgi:hypothetical protein|nr:polysaccharide pyruvyl transferase family protein [Planctomycetaceae bacterium]